MYWHTYIYILIFIFLFWQPNCTTIWLHTTILILNTFWLISTVLTYKYISQIYISMQIHLYHIYTRKHTQMILTSRAFCFQNFFESFFYSSIRSYTNFTYIIVHAIFGQFVLTNWLWTWKNVYIYLIHAFTRTRVRQYYWMCTRINKYKSSNTDNHFGTDRHEICPLPPPDPTHTSISRCIISKQKTKKCPHWHAHWQAQIGKRKKSYSPRRWIVNFETCVYLYTHPFVDE